MKNIWYIIYLFCFVISEAVFASGPPIYSYETRRPQMMIFSDHDGKKITVTYHIEKHWDDQSITLDDGSRVQRHISMFTGVPGIAYRLNPNMHIGGQLQWHLFDVAVLAYFQYDFLRWASGKLSTSLMYKGTFIFISPGTGLQLAGHQTLVTSGGDTGLAIEGFAGLNIRYLDFWYDEVRTQGVSSPYAHYYSSFGTLNVFAGLNFYWSYFVLRSSVGWESPYWIKNKHNPAGYDVDFDRKPGVCLWSELGLRM